jgi:hypothetical protein
LFGKLFIEYKGHLETMKIVNGKLLGQPKGELDIFKESQNRQNQSIQISLQQLTQGIDAAENLLKEESLVEGLANYLGQLEGRCHYLEQEQKKLQKTKQPANQKLLWLTFASSIVFSIMSFSVWWDIYPIQRSLKKAEYSLNHFTQLDQQII